MHLPPAGQASSASSRRFRQYVLNNYSKHACPHTVHFNDAPPKTPRKDPAVPAEAAVTGTPRHVVSRRTTVRMSPCPAGADGGTSSTNERILVVRLTAIAVRSIAMVLSAGTASEATGRSSTPMSARSSGTAMSRVRQFARTARASRSLNAATAVTGVASRVHSATAAPGALLCVAQFDDLRRRQTEVVAGLLGVLHARHGEGALPGIVQRGEADVPVPPRGEVLDLQPSDVLGPDSCFSGRRLVYEQQDLDFVRRGNHDFEPLRQTLRLLEADARRTTPRLSSATTGDFHEQLCLASGNTWLHYSRPSDQIASHQELIDAMTTKTPGRLRPRRATRRRLGSARFRRAPCRRSARHAVGTGLAVASTERRSSRAAVKASGFTPVRAPRRSSSVTITSVARFPWAPGANGQPP
jgi:hypothetical protein